MALDGQSTNSKSKEREGFGALHVDVDLVHALVELGANPAVRYKNKGGSFALNKGDGGRSVGLPIFSYNPGQTCTNTRNTSIPPGVLSRQIQTDGRHTYDIVLTSK